MEKEGKKVRIEISATPEMPEAFVAAARAPIADSPLLAKVIAGLRTVYDPELPVNVYDLGLIYHISATTEGDVTVQMTLTAPNCPVADQIVRDVETKVKATAGVNHATVELVWEPKWHKGMMSEAAKLELGFFE